VLRLGLRGAVLLVLRGAGPLRAGVLLGRLAGALLAVERAGADPASTNSKKPMFLPQSRLSPLAIRI
jgi:hypothetical protein